MTLFSRDKSETVLEETENTFELLVNSINDYAIVMLDPQGQIMTWNPGAKKIAGYETDEILNCHFSCFYTKKDRDSGKPEQHLEKAYKQGASENEGWRVRKNGVLFWAHVIITRMLDEKGDLKGFSKVTRDVTKEKRVQEDLSQSFEHLTENEQKLQFLLDAVQDYAIHMLDGGGTVMNWNSGARRITGYTPKEIIGKHFSLFFSKEDLARGKPRSLLDKAEEEGRATDRGWRIRKNGTRFFGEVAITPMYDPEGWLIGFTHVTRDITASKALEETQLSKEQLDVILSNLDDAVWVFDTEESLIYCNPKAAKMAGFLDCNQMVYISLSEIRDKMQVLTESGLSLSDSPTRKALSGKTFFQKLIRQGVKGKKDKWFLVSAIPIRGEDGVVRMAITTLRDITGVKSTEEALRKSEEQLRQLQKMEAIGNLAGGLAHDFNNFLTTINGYACLVLEQLEAESPIREPLVAIQRAGERSAILTNQLLVFSQRPVLPPKLMDLNKLMMMNLETLLQRLMGEDVEISISLAIGLGKIKADPGQIEHVIMNLAANARDAMPKGGKLTVQTSQVELNSKTVAYRPNMAPGPFAMLSISDTGIGMNAETLSRIFEPFFTLKAPGKGKGLGLSMVFAIVDHAGGKIDVRSTPGQGTAFDIYLPIFTEDPMAAEGIVQDINHEDLRGRETIMVVEDEAILRKMIREVLLRADYRVLEAGNGEEALEIIRSGEKPALVITDLVMPKMNGSQLAEGLAQIHQDVKVIFMSGYTSDALAIKGIQASKTAFLQKPFSPTLLLQTLRETLKS